MMCYSPSPSARTKLRLQDSFFHSFRSKKFQRLLQVHCSKDQQRWNEECHKLKKELKEISKGQGLLFYAGSSVYTKESVANYEAFQILAFALHISLVVPVRKIFHGQWDQNSFEKVNKDILQYQAYEPNKWIENQGIESRWYLDEVINNANGQMANQEKWMSLLEEIKQSYLARRVVDINENTHVTTEQSMSTGGHLLHFKNVNTPIHLGNAMSFELTIDTTIMEFLRMCKFLNPTNEAGKLIVIVKLDTVIIGQLDIYLRASREQGIAVMWVINPFIGSIGHKAMPIILSLEYMRDWMMMFQKEKTRVGGLYLDFVAPRALHDADSLSLVEALRVIETFIRAYRAGYLLS